MRIGKQKEIIWDAAKNSNYLLQILTMHTHPQPITFDEIVEAIEEGPLVWKIWDKNQGPHILNHGYTEREMHGYIGFNDEIIIHFVIRRGTSILDALYDIEEHEPEIPTSLLAILLFASEIPFPNDHRKEDELWAMYHTINQLAWVAAKIAEKVSPIRRMSRKELETTLTPTTAGIEVPTGATNVARWLIMFSKCIWQPIHIRAGISSEPEAPKLIDPITQIAQWLWPEKCNFKVGNVVAHTPRLHENATWAEAAAWIMGEIDAPALTEFQNLPTDDDSYFALSNLPKLEIDVAIATIRKLINEGTKNQAYIPNGLFHLLIPANLTGWHKAGISTLCVYANTNYMWACGITKEGKRTTSVYWWPDIELATPNLRNQIAQSPWAYITLTLTAFWHDLIVKGPEVIIETEGRGPRAYKPRPEPQQIPKDKVLNLPRTSIVISGTRSWSDGEDHEKIKRTLTYIKRLLGFPRRLHEGWKRSAEIQDFLDENGIILADGYTYVRPVTQNTTSDGEPRRQPIIAKARGLQALALMLDNTPNPKETK